MRTRTRARLALSLLLLALAPAVSRAQVRVDALTEVRSIHFDGVHSIPQWKLDRVIQTPQRGFAYGLRVALGKIPLVPSPAHHPFSPLELQQDVVRLRSEYRSAGFFTTQVRYDVERNDEENLLDITFVIEEGPPLVLVDVRVTGPDSVSAPVVPEKGRKSWEKLVRSVESQRGDRLDVAEVRKSGNRLTDWWRARGFPRARAATNFHADSLRSQGWLVYRILVGPTARFGDVRIEGLGRLEESTVRRQVPIDPGDPYSAKAIEQARLGVQSLEMVRVAHVDVPSLGAVDTGFVSPRVADSLVAVPVDSLLPVRVRITEADPHLVSGDLGYVTDAGVSTEARWISRDFTGGGRSLTVTGLAQSGWLALVQSPDIRYRLAVALKQSGFLRRRGSGLVTPFFEVRDDAQDRSAQYGLNTTYIYQFGQFKSVSLDYQIARRQIYEYHIDDLASGKIDLYTFITRVAQGVSDSLGTRVNTSNFTLSTNFGLLDDFANPRRGIVVRPAVQVTAPTSLSTTAYWRYDVSANGFLPLGRPAVLATRVSYGRLIPFGKSLPGPGDDPEIKFLQLHDVLFTAGGTGETRGWENRLLGPKVPNVLFDTVADTLVPRVEGYVPVGGLARAAFSAELQLPLPPFGPNFRSHFFLDGGRVWTDDTRYGKQGDPYGQERFFFATGGGLSMATPVGPIKVSVGYKLNPSITDLVDAADIQRAATAGTPLDQLARHQSRRWQLHLAIGTTF